MQTLDRIIVALDVRTLDEATRIVDMLGTEVMYKVGLELISSVGGPQTVKHLHSLGATIFYDGKFSDIPITMARASSSIAQLGVFMFSVHASSGVESMQAAKRASGNSRVLAVTVLSSFDDNASSLIFGRGSTVASVKFARLAADAKVDGIICAPQILEVLSGNHEFSWDTWDIIVTTGIRPEWAPSDDQARFSTPTYAVQNGADYLVIGRPITRPPDGMTSEEALNRIAKEIEKAL